MVTAIVLIKVERLKLQETAEALLELDEVKEVYSVAGEYDLVAIVRVRRHEDLADVVTRHIACCDGIVATRTVVAFRAYSRHDLEAMYDLGGSAGAPADG